MASPPNTPQQDLNARIAALRTELAGVDSKIDDVEKLQQTKDRSLIANIVVGLFAFCVVGLIAFVMIYAHDDANWEKPSRFMLEVLSSVLLPVVTLVLGFYFGTTKKP